jgi:hypothetical protein
MLVVKTAQLESASHAFKIHESMTVFTTNPKRIGFKLLDGNKAA